MASPNKSHSLCSGSRCNDRISYKQFTAHLSLQANERPKLYERATLVNPASPLTPLPGWSISWDETVAQSCLCAETSLSLPDLVKQPSILSGAMERSRLEMWSMQTQGWIPFRWMFTLHVGWSGGLVLLRRLDQDVRIPQPKDLEEILQWENNVGLLDVTLAEHEAS